MPTWIVIAIVGALFTAAALAWFFQGSSEANVAPKGPTIDEGVLIEQLHSFDVDLQREQTPPPSLLAGLIREDETLLAATRAKIEERKALVAILDDRLVSVEATLGRMGAQARVIPHDTVESVTQRTDLGGEITIEADGTTHVFTHIPLRKFEPFGRKLRELTSD